MKHLVAKLWAGRSRKRLLYALFFQVAFAAAFALTFPYDALRDRVVSLAGQAGVKVRIGTVRLALPAGITLRDVDWYASSDADSKPIHVDAFTARPELLGLVRGKQAVGFQAEAWGGKLQGRFEKAGEGQKIEAKARGIALEKSPLANSGLDLEGELAELELSFESDGDLSKATGALLLKGDKLSLNGGEVQQFELPKVVLGSLDGKVSIKEGRATFDTFSLKGDDIDARLEGSIRLGNKLSTSALSGKLQFKPSDDWWSRNEMLRTAANFALPEGKDGFRSVQIYGQVQSPRFRTK